MHDNLLTKRVERTPQDRQERGFAKARSEGMLSSPLKRGGYVHLSSARRAQGTSDGTTSASSIARDASIANRLYLQHGRHANSWAAAFDADLERWVDTDARGLVSFARYSPLSITMGFFDPLCSESDLDPVLGSFLADTDCSVFWKVSRGTAQCLAARGWCITPYGIEHEVFLPLELGGSRRRNLRREIASARRSGLVVEQVEAAEPGAPIWDELAQVTRRWLLSRTQRHEIRRATRRTPHRHEAHCTKVVCRSAATGHVRGWAAFDHIYDQGRLAGVGLNAVRWDSAKAGTTNGIASLLAAEGAKLVRMVHGHDDATPFVLSLGESPFGVPVPSGEGSMQCSALRASLPLQALFALIRKYGEPLYAVRGLDTWKRKWRAESAFAPTGPGKEVHEEVQITYIATKHELPLLEVGATLALVLGKG